MTSQSKQPTESKQRSMTPMDLMLFFETLGLLLSSGMPVLDSLKLMHGDAEKKKDKDTLAKLLSVLASTYNLSTAMTETGLFPPYAASMVHLAEHSGNLDKVCVSLASYYELENQRSALVKSAIANPFVLVCIMTVVVAFLVNFILPIFANIYRQMGVNMTSNTLVQVALTIGSVAMWTVFAVLVLAITGYLYAQTKSGQRFFAVVTERFPLPRRFQATLSMARFTSTFSLLLSSGGDLPTAMSLASTVCPSRRIRAKIGQCHKQILTGASLADVLINSDLFNPTHIGMIKSGVRLGATPKVMERLAQIYEEDSERMLSKLLALIEPLLIGALSVIIGVILLCIMLPLIGILSSIG